MIYSLSNIVTLRNKTILRIYINVPLFKTICFINSVDKYNINYVSLRKKVTLKMVKIIFINKLFPNFFFERCFYLWDLQRCATYLILK